MLTPTPHSKVSIAEYLIMQEMANIKLEYARGQVYAMAGGTADHAGRAAAIIAALATQLRDRRAACSAATRASASTPTTS